MFAASVWDLQGCFLHQKLLMHLAYVLEMLFLFCKLFAWVGFPGRTGVLLGGPDDLRVFFRWAASLRLPHPIPQEGF